MNKLANIDVVFHIGQHKSGTTYLQNRFSENYEILSEKYNLLFPKTGFLQPSDNTGRPKASPGHQGIMRAILDRNAFKLRSLHNEIESSNAHTVLISCENFCHPLDSIDLRQAKHARVLNFSKNFKSCRVIYVVRSPEEYLEKMFVEQICSHNVREQRDIHSFIEQEKDKLFDLSGQLMPWDTITTSKLEIHLYDQLNKSNDYLNNFLSLIVFPDKAELQSPKINSSLNDIIYSSPDTQKVEFIRLINMLISNKFRRRKIKKEILSLEFSSTEQKNYSFLSPEIKISYLEAFLEKNKQFSEKFELGLENYVAEKKTSIANQEWRSLDAINHNYIKLVESIIDTNISSNFLNQINFFGKSLYRFSVKSKRSIVSSLFFLLSIFSSVHFYAIRFIRKNLYKK